MIVAIINTLQAMVNDSCRRNEERGQRENILTIFLTAVVSFLLELLGDIAKFANSILLPYLSVNGTSYEESVVKSFQLLVNSGMQTISSLYSVGFVIFTINLIFFGSSII